jgi:Arc/MetJ-type ribon-helix-helix transcriptional regulator
VKIVIRKIGSESFELDLRMPKTVSIKMEQRLLRQMDEAWRKMGYKTRSEFIRDAIEVYIKILEELSKQPQNQSSAEKRIDIDTILEKISPKMEGQK